MNISHDKENYEQHMFANLMNWLMLADMEYNIKNKNIQQTKKTPKY